MTMPRHRSPTDTAVKVITKCSYMIQGAQCAVPAAILHEMWLDAQANIYSNVGTRLFVVAISAFFFVSLGAYRRNFLSKMGGR